MGIYKELNEQADYLSIIVDYDDGSLLGLDKICFFSCLFCFSFVLNICTDFAFQCTHFAFYRTHFAFYFSLNLANYDRK